jgi:hypothetical protein
MFVFASMFMFATTFQYWLGPQEEYKDVGKNKEGGNIVSIFKIPIKTNNGFIVAGKARRAKTGQLIRTGVVEVVCKNNKFITWAYPNPGTKETNPTTDWEVSYRNLTLNSGKYESISPNTAWSDLAKVHCSKPISPFVAFNSDNTFVQFQSLTQKEHVYFEYRSGQTPTKIIRGTRAFVCQNKQQPPIQFLMEIDAKTQKPLAIEMFQTKLTKNTELSAIEKPMFDFVCSDTSVVK